MGEGKGSPSGLHGWGVEEGSSEEAKTTRALLDSIVRDYLHYSLGDICIFTMYKVQYQRLLSFLIQNSIINSCSDRIRSDLLTKENQHYVVVLFFSTLYKEITGL